jgi:peptidyl-prolyl cis-trans isomerase SurA
MRNIFTLAALLLAATPLQAQDGIGGQVASNGPELVDRVVAVVGDTVLLLSDVQTEMQQFQLPQDPRQVEEMARGVVERQVSNLILISAAREAGMFVPDDQVIEIVDQNMREVQRRFGSEAAFVAALAESGMTREQYRQMLIGTERDQLLVQQFLAQRLRNRARPMIDERDIRDFFETQRGALQQRPATVSFRQVVVTPRASEEARRAAIARAEEALAELNTGADFAVIARRFSDDPGTREHGGDLGWFRAEGMVPEFSRVAFALRPGQTSGLVETEFGFHVIRVDRVRGAERQARHILITPELTDADLNVARVRADSVAQAIRDGATIATLAARYNTPDDQVTVTRAPIDRLPPAYGEALGNVGPNEVVGPIVLQDDRLPRFAVLRVTERLEAGDYTLEDVREQIRGRLQEEVMMEQLLDELRDQVYVSVLM